MARKLIFFLMSITFSLGSFSQVKNVNGTEVHRNALINESSPYLLEHAHNPVEWYPWGNVALEKAKRENKLMVISIGYAACHWCHVMERETFSDTVVANFMNKHFISVKVDREERPDVDQVYMDAVQMITGQGGWPLNAFALPDGLPFHAGTYFPRDQWLQLLKLITKTYATDKEKVILQAAAIRDGMASQGLVASPESADLQFKLSEYQKVFNKWEPSIDFEWGGYDRTPKFPQPATWESLLQFHYITGDEKSLRAVTTTLDKMSLGGIYDHVNGGFARYSTDRYWKVPHFEKMLYDNGQLVSLYAHAYQVTGKKHYAGIVNETLGFIESELTTTEGGFYSSLNADSEGEEGKFYVWTKPQLDHALTGETVSVVSTYFQVKEEGNWEHGKNILHATMLKDDFARKHQLGEAAFDKTLLKAKESLRKVQRSRIRPSTDDKILTSWNAIMMKGYIDAYRAMGNPEFLASAMKSASFLEKNMMKADSGLWRNYKNGKATIPGFLDDYALLADAYIELYQVTFDIHWLNLAQRLTRYAIGHFFDKKSGMFFYTSNQAQDLVIRKIEIVDTAIPSSNSVMAYNLLRLGAYFYDEDYLIKARTMVANLEKEIRKDGSYYAHWVKLYGLMAAEPYEIAIVGNDYQQKTRSFQKQYLPTSFFSGGQQENLPLLEMKLVPGKTTIYVCRNRVCKLPVNDVPQAMKLLVR